MSVDPCDDFFRFACKPATKGISASAPKTNEPLLTLKQLVKNPPEGFEYVKTFYQSCTRISTGFTSEEVLYTCTAGGDCSDEKLEPFGRVYKDFITYLKRFITDTKFPVATPNWENVTQAWYGGQGWNWWDFSSGIIRDNFLLATLQYVTEVKDKEVASGVDVFRANLFFVPMIETTVDYRYDDGDHLPKIHLVPMKVSGFLREGGNATIIAKYKGFMKALLGYLSPNAPSLEKDIERIVELELELGKINRWSGYYSCKKEWEIITIAELYRRVPTVEWQDYIQATLQSNTEFRVQRYTRVAVPHGILKEMGDWIKKMEANRRDQANLLIWRMMVMFANNFMHTGLEEEEGNLQDNIFVKINPEAKTRSENCLTQIRTFFPAVEDDMLIAHYVKNDTKMYFGSLFENLKDSFARMIRNAEWMTQRTKVRAKEKLDKTGLLIGERLPKTPEFQELKSNMSLDYIANILVIGNYKWDTLVKSLRKEKNTDRGYEKEESAYYDSGSNTARIKIGLLRNVLGLGFSKAFPSAIIYSAFVASSLGHELVHGFDSNGRKLDKNGFELKWWEPSDEAEFDNRTLCMVSLQHEEKAWWRTLDINLELDDHRIL